MKTRVAKEYLSQLQKRYKKATKSEKQIILDELTKTVGYERKYTINLLRGNYQHKTGRIYRPRKRIYTLSDANILVKICDLLDWINSKRIQPQIEVAIKSLGKAGEIYVSLEQKQRLIKISPSSIDRLLTRYNKRPKGKGRSYTKPGTLLKTQIPIRTFADWNEDKVGFEEIDLVGHDGGVASGDFAWTLNFVDVKVEWGEQVAVKNKAQKHVFAGIKMVRGRAGKKNDNPFVEEKNNSIVRRWVGYGRYDSEKQVDILNEFYEVLRLYTNFFLPVQKLIRKEKIGSKTKKVHDKAKTPYQRILEADDISEEIKSKLRAQYTTLDLVSLKRQVDAILKRLKPTPVR